MSAPAPSFNLPPELDEKLRRITLWLTPVGVVVMILALWQNTKMRQGGREVFYGLPILCLLFAVVWVLALKRRLSGQRAALAFTFPICCQLYVEQLEHALNGSLYRYGDPGNFGWMFVMYLLIFLTLDTRRASGISLAFLITHIAIYFSRRFSHHPAPEVETNFIHHFAASLIGIGLLGFTAELRQQLGAAQSLASTDPLTGLLNRRQMQHHLEASSDREFAVLLMDIDHFKQINDQHGHSMGDTVLRLLSQELSQTLEADCLLGRWGGEEFLLLLPGTPSTELPLLAERLLHTTRELVLPEGLTVTISIGGSHSSGSERPEAVIQRADRALYQAKQGGRNRFQPHTESSSTLQSRAA